MSRKGYTSGAIKAAADRDVVLYTLQDLDSVDLFGWLGMAMIQTCVSNAGRFRKKGYNFK